VNGDIGAALAAMLQLPDLKPERCYQSLHLVGGYNRKWNLPLPQTWAIEAGSAFVFPAGSFAPEELRRLAELGVGERRAEGFGRLAVNWQSYHELSWKKSDPPETERIELSEESKALARQMANRRLRLWLDQRLVAAVNRVQIGAQRPQNSQLSRIRSVAQQALVEGDLNGLQKHLAHMKGAREQFERARIDNTPMDRWIEERAKNRDIEVQLQLGQPPVLPDVAGQKAQLTLKLRIEYTARLIDGVMKRTAKLNQKQEEGS
jgi:CRISPR-associated protein Csx10